MNHKIVEIHSEDAFYDIKEQLVGKVVHIQEDEVIETEFEGFVTATVYLYEPVEMSWGDLTLVPFTYVKLEKI